MRAAIIIAGLFMLTCPVNTYAAGLQINEDDAIGNDCAQCDEMCAEPTEGESIRSLNNWLCQQCLKLCQDQNTETENNFEEYEIQPCPAKPVT